MPEENSLNRVYSRIRGLQFGNAGSVVGALDTEPFSDSIYVADGVDQQVHDFFNTDKQDGKLLIITGSAGDGKSAIFSQAFKKASEEGMADWLDEEHINLDATASSRRDQSVFDDLENFLENAQEGLKTSSGPRHGIAINLGLAIGFFTSSGAGKSSEFKLIWDAIDAARDPSNLDEDGIYDSNSNIIVVNLSYRPLYQTHPSSFGDGLLRRITDRFDYQNPNSPLHGIEALPEEPLEGVEDPEAPFVIHNLCAIALDTVRQKFVEQVVGKSIATGRYVNPRKLLHQLSTALFPPELQSIVDRHGILASEECLVDEENVEDLLFWNTVFSDSAELEVPKLDPCAVQSQSVDEKILELGGAPQDDAPYPPVPGFADLVPLAKARTWVRYRYLRQIGDVETVLEKDRFERFRGSLSFLDKRQDGTTHDEADPGQLTQDAFGKLSIALQSWKGRSANDDFIEVSDGLQSDDFQFFAEWEEGTEPAPPESKTKTTKETRPGTVWFVFEENDIQIPLTYELYRLIEAIAEGYNPNALDLEGSEGVRLIRSLIDNFTDKNTELEIRTQTGDPLYRVAEQPFSSEIKIEDIRGE